MENEEPSPRKRIAVLYIDDVEGRAHINQTLLETDTTTKSIVATHPLIVAELMFPILLLEKCSQH